MDSSLDGIRAVGKCRAATLHGERQPSPARLDSRAREPPTAPQRLSNTLDRVPVGVDQLARVTPHCEQPRRVGSSLPRRSIALTTSPRRRLRRKSSAVGTWPGCMTLHSAAKPARHAIAEVGPRGWHRPHTSSTNTSTTPAPRLRRRRTRPRRYGGPTTPGRRGGAWHGSEPHGGGSDAPACCCSAPPGCCATVCEPPRAGMAGRVIRRRVLPRIGHEAERVAPCPGAPRGTAAAAA